MAFIFSYITAIMLNSDRKLEKRELIYIGIFLVLYLMADFVFEIKLKIYTIVQLWLCAVILVLIINNKKIIEKFKTAKVYNFALITILSLGLILGIVFRYDQIGQNEVKGYLQNNDADTKQITSYGTILDFKDAISHIQEKDKDFFRIMKSPYYAMNTSMWMGYNAIGGYFSILPETYQKMSKELLNSQYYRLNFGIHEFDYRTKIASLLGEKYLIINDNNAVPYGYRKLEDYNGESNIYINDYNLPFGVLYTNYIDKKEYQALTPLQRESSLLKTATVQRDKLQNKELKHMEQFDYNTIIK